MDRCQTVTTAGIVARTCTNKALNDMLQIKDNACTKKTNLMNIEMEWCVCDKEGCDPTPSAKSTPSAISTPSAESASISKSQSANQLILIVAISSLMKLVLN